MASSAGFVHLNVRSYFSLRDGAFSPEDLVRRAAALGMPAVAVTDRDGLYGSARFAAACGREGIRPIFGATLTVRVHQRTGTADRSSCLRRTTAATGTSAGCSPTRT
jgi:error-prone DNA polymerase